MLLCLSALLTGAVPARAGAPGSAVASIAATAGDVEVQGTVQAAERAAGDLDDGFEGVGTASGGLSGPMAASFRVPPVRTDRCPEGIDVALLDRPPRV